MPTIDELLERRADRGETRGAAEVWHAASMPTYASPQPPTGRTRHGKVRIAAAAILMLVALGAGWVAGREGPNTSAVDDLASGGAPPAWWNDAASLPAGTEVVIAFLEVDDPVPLSARVGELQRLPGVLDARGVDRVAAYTEFRRLFPDPDMIDAVDPTRLPESVRLLVSVDGVDPLGELLERQPGVWLVATASERGR